VKDAFERCSLETPLRERETAHALPRVSNFVSQLSAELSRADADSPTFSCIKTENTNKKSRRDYITNRVNLDSATANI
jgi:hypothetical protein